MQEKVKGNKLRGYLIEKYNHMTNAYTCNRLVREAEALGMELTIAGIEDTAASPRGLENAGRILERRDFVINRYKWGKLKDGINALALRSYNESGAFNLYINKYEQVKRLSSEAFLMPEYLLGMAGIPYDDLIRRLGSPVVAKGLESSMGAEIYLIRRAEDLKRLADLYGPEKEWLFEEYISTSYGRDIRVYSIRGNAAAAMERRSAGDFRANVALGASVRPCEITDGIRTIAGDMYRQTGLDFLGIDLMFGTDKPYFCEINVMPGIEGIEKASGLNIAGKVMETIRGDFENDEA